MFSGDVRLPRRGLGEEHTLHLLKGLSSSLGKKEKDVDCHGGAKDGEDEIDLPLNVDKGWWYKVAECEVEDPIARRAESYGLASHAQREQLGRIDPRGRSPGDGERGDEEISRCDNRLRGWTGDTPTIDDGQRSAS